MDAAEFVRTIELYHKPLHHNLLAAPPKPVSITDYTEQGNVVAGGLQAFTANVTGQVKQDILDATLLAQLHANHVMKLKGSTREDKPVEWYKTYVSTLENIGFEVKEFDFTEYNSHGQSFKMDRAVLEILKAGLTRNGTAVANATIDALGKLPGDGNSVTLFDNQSSDLKQGNFQIGICDQAPNGDVSIGLGAFYFTATKHDTRYIFGSWTSTDISLHWTFESLVLNETKYAKVRKEIIKKLGDKTKTMVASIDI